MLVVRRLDFDSKDTMGGALDHVLAAVTAVDGEREIWAYLEDSAHAKVSAVARALKKHPALAALGPPPRGAVRTRLASLPDRDAPDPPWEAPIDRATAVAVAHAIPRSLPFWYSDFVVGPLPSLWLVPGEPPRPRRLNGHFNSPDDVPASIAVVARGRMIYAHLHMPAPPRDATKLPPLPERTRRLLDLLGKPVKEQQDLVPDADEANLRREADPAAEALVQAVNLDAVAYPHPDLADDPGGDAFGSFKDELPRVLPGFRYRPTGRRGVWRMTKRTAAQNELVFEVDRGPMGGHARASLVVRGPLWSHHFAIPARRGARELKVWDPATLTKLCANYGAAVTMLERDVIPELERLYWPGFAWYAAD